MKGGSMVIAGRRVGWIDLGLVLLISGLAVWSMVIGVTDPVESAPIQAVPLILLVTVPLLFWRADPVLASGLVLAGTLIHIAAAPGTVRCGVLIPVTFILAVSAGAKLDLSHSLIALGLALAALWAIAFAEPASGAPLVAFPFVTVIVVGLWGVGRLLHDRARLIARLRGQRQEITETRERRAELEVAAQRMRIAGELDAALAERLGDLATMAEHAASAEEPATHAALGEIERQSRQTLDEMRTVVGTLREPDGAPGV